MTKTISMCWWAVLFALGSGVTASAVPGSYTTRILNTPDGFKAPKLTAINASGLIAGTAQDSLGRTHAFVWQSGNSIRELTTPAGYIASGIHDMNDLGQCVGYATDASDNGHAIVWDVDGTPRDLGALDGLYSIARGINNSGQIAGSSGAPDGTVHAMLWNASGGFTDLGQTYGWGWSRAHDINDSGQVVGASGGGSWTAFLLSGSNRIDLSARAGVSSGEAVALNNHGDAVGANGGLGGTPVLWRADGAIITLDVLGSSGTYAWSINDATQIVGWSQLPITGLPLPADHAVTWDSAGQLTDINPAGFASSHAYDISKGGWIVGSCSDSKTSYAVVWMPVPEPGSLCSLASGVVALAMVRRSRRLSFAHRR